MQPIPMNVSPDRPKPQPLFRRYTKPSKIKKKGDEVSIKDYFYRQPADRLVIETSQDRRERRLRRFRNESLQNQSQARTTSQANTQQTNATQFRQLPVVEVVACLVTMLAALQLNKQ